MPTPHSRTRALAALYVPHVPKESKSPRIISAHSLHVLAPLTPHTHAPRHTVRCPIVADPSLFATDVDVALLGVPFDGGVSNRPGARHGPRAVRDQSSLVRGIHHLTRVNPFDLAKVADVGDVPFSSLTDLPQVRCAVCVCVWCVVRLCCVVCVYVCVVCVVMCPSCIVVMLLASYEYLALLLLAAVAAHPLSPCLYSFTTFLTTFLHPPHPRMSLPHASFYSATAMWSHSRLPWSTPTPPSSPSVATTPSPSLCSRPRWGHWPGHRATPPRSRLCR